MSAKAKPSATNDRQPYKVFVSSTYLDNKERRRVVQETITLAEMVWHGMEIFTVSTPPDSRRMPTLFRRETLQAKVLTALQEWRKQHGPQPEPEPQLKTVSGPPLDSD